MLLNSVILVLREVLEAAMLISVLLALSLSFRQRISWLWWGLGLGFLGSVLFASLLEVITDSLDGAGQEVANASLQGLVYCLTVAVVACSQQQAHGDSPRRVMSLLMASAVACAMIREGSEILVYITGFAASQEHWGAVYAGSAMGAGIGVSLGVLLFSALRALENDRTQFACIVLVAMMGAGMIMQAAQLLEQVDWLPAGLPIWDSSGLLSERSIAGQLLYAVFGYEATPSSIQVALYGASLLGMLAAYYFSRGFWSRASEA